LDEAVSLEYSNFLSEIQSRIICRLQIFRNGDISFGLGKEIKHGNAKLRDNFYGEWEVGSFHHNWKVMRCGVEFSEVLMKEKLIGNLILGEKLISINVIKKTQVEVKISNEVTFEFGSSDDLEDESFHVFCPDKTVWVYTPIIGWFHDKQ
jgi:hypothetical protein